jgi:MFS family permease
MPDQRSPDDLSAEPVPLKRNLDFLAFLACRAGYVVGSHSFSVAIGWHVYKISGDPYDLGLIGLAQFAPALALFLVAGMVADRFDRRRILLVCAGVHICVVATIAALFTLGLQSVPAILAVLVVQGAARSFFHTSAQAILPNLVTPEQFPRAVAFASATYKAAVLAGPALGGLLIAWTDQHVYYYILIFYAATALGAALIRHRLRVEAPTPVTLETVTGGFRYVWNNKIVLGAMSIDLIAVLFGGVMGLLPVFAKDILHVGPDGLGIMRAMPGAGALVVGIVLTQITRPRHMGPALFLSVAVFGASVILFSQSTVFWLSLVALALYGGADMISVFVRQTLVQLSTPDTMRGRVSALNSVSINASNELGDFRAGITAGAIGSAPAVLVGGVVTVAVAVAWWRLFPSIDRIDRLDQLNAAAAPQQKGRP